MLCKNLKCFTSIAVGHAHLTHYLLSSYRYLSDEGIAELKGSVEKITLNDIIRIALDVSSNLASFKYACSIYVVVCRF